MTEAKRPLKIFLCHAHADSAPVRALYAHLTKYDMDAWPDKEELLLGEDWEYEIREVVQQKTTLFCRASFFNLFWAVVRR